MTQDQLADPLNISPQAVSRWETDSALPEISLLPVDYDLITLFARTELAKLSVVSSVKKLQKHIETTCPNSSEYEEIYPRLELIVNTDTFQ